MSETTQTDTQPIAGPVSIDQYLDAKMAPPPADTPVDAVEEDADVIEDVVEEVAVEAEADGDEAAPEKEAETDETDEPDAIEDDGPQILTVDEYGDVAVEIDGERTTLKDLAKGTLRQADYSRKTQALAEQKKELQEVAKQQAETQRQIDAAILELRQDEIEPDWEKMAEERPLDWQIEKLKYDKRQAQAQRAKADAEMRQTEQFNAMRQHTAKIAVEKVPEWTSAEAFAKDEPSRRNLAMEAGFTPEEYDGAPDLRFAVLLEWARIGREKAERPNVVEKRVVKRPKVLRPGQGTDKAQREAAKRSVRSQKLDRAHSIQEHLDAIFSD